MGKTTNSQATRAILNSVNHFSLDITPLAKRRRREKKKSKRILYFARTSLLVPSFRSFLFVDLLLSFLFCLFFFSRGSTIVMRGGVNTNQTFRPTSLKLGSPRTRTRRTRAQQASEVRNNSSLSTRPSSRRGISVVS